MNFAANTKFINFMIESLSEFFFYKIIFKISSKNLQFLNKLYFILKIYSLTSILQFFKYLLNKRVRIDIYLEKACLIKVY